MIRLGMHADNMRTISQSLQDAVKLGKKYGLEFTESGFVQGNYYVQWMGFEPSVSMLQNPIAIRKMCEEAGASAITIHPRTREDFFSGKIDVNDIKKVKEGTY